MPGYTSTYEAASLDRTARVVTRSLWLRNVVLLEVGDFPLALSPRDPEGFIAEVGHGQ